MKDKLLELPFDQFQRYAVLRECIAMFKTHQNIDRVKILDVGGYPGLISEFIENDDTTIADLPPSEMENYVQADGTNLPFENESFDVVTSADALEHVEPTKRVVFIAENLRVCKDLFILICPVKNQVTDLADELLYQYVWSTQGKSFDTLKEHLGNGLPDLSFIADVFDKGKIPYISFPSGYIYHWMIMMLVKFYFHTLPDSERLHKLTDKLYNMQFSPYDHQAPAYRTVFVVSKRGDKKLLDKIRNHYDKLEKDTPQEASQKLQLFSLLFELSELETKHEIKHQKEQLEKLEKEMVAAREKIQLQQEIIREREKYIAEIEEWLRQIQRRPSYRVYRGLRNLFVRQPRDLEGKK